MIRTPKTNQVVRKTNTVVNSKENRKVVQQNVIKIILHGSVRNSIYIFLRT